MAGTLPPDYEREPWERAEARVRVPAGAGLPGGRRDWEIGYFAGDSHESWTVLANTPDLEYARYLVALHNESAVKDTRIEALETALRDLWVSSQDLGEAVDDVIEALQKGVPPLWEPMHEASEAMDAAEDQARAALGAAQEPEGEHGR